MTFGAKQHFDILKMLGGCSLSKKSSQDFFDKLRKYAGKPAYFLYYSAFFAMHSCRVCMMVYALSQST